MSQHCSGSCGASCCTGRVGKRALKLMRGSRPGPRAGVCWRRGRREEFEVELFVETGELSLGGRREQLGGHGGEHAVLT
jgi:hypothetical protein